MSFAVRGIVEGFYGTQWSHAERLAALAFLGAQGMNAYMYAPKDDVLHREHWRDSYDNDAIARFAELTATGRAHGVHLHFEIRKGKEATNPLYYLP